MGFVFIFILEGTLVSTVGNIFSFIAFTRPLTIGLHVVFALSTRPEYGVFDNTRARGDSDSCVGIDNENLFKVD